MKNRTIFWVKKFPPYDAGSADLVSDAREYTNVQYFNYKNNILSTAFHYGATADVNSYRLAVARFKKAVGDKRKLREDQKKLIVPEHAFDYNGYNYFI